MSSKPDTITIESSGERTLTADSATATVVLEGDSAFSGSAAFKKAQEVSELVDALVDIGVDRDTISIRDVRIESSSIVGIKSSSARYSIQIREIPTDSLPTALATIASRKQADLRSLRWVFSSLSSEKESLRQAVIGSSLKKANATAAALGVSILGVFSFTESVDEPGQATERFGEDRVMARMKKTKSAPTEIGFSLMHSGRLRISTKTEFRVSAIAGRAE